MLVGSVGKGVTALKAFPGESMAKYLHNVYTNAYMSELLPCMGGWVGVQGTHIKHTHEAMQLPHS